mmetsp:Transcript_53145/g.60222  ORF Transcript_53145/g.60222 Transcript_53145/m.60222 type:complete len:805 (-) Transcript_53145:268-2682(-)
MFPNSNTNKHSTPISDELIGINGIPKPKSLLSSFLFSRLSSPPVTTDQQQQQQNQLQRPQTHRLSSSASAVAAENTTMSETGFPFNTPSSLQSNALPSCLLEEHNERIHINDDNNVNNNINNSSNNTVLRSRTITDDATAIPMLGGGGVLLLPRPRRSWNISNDDRKALPKVPEYYYPQLFDPNCTALVTDSPPSIVVVRISECLRRRSIAVEYDDDSVTAKCMTVDRTHFVIQLYRTSSSPSSTLIFNSEQQQQQDENNGHNITMMTGAGTSTSNGTIAVSSSASSSLLLSPPNDSIIVECQKTSGNSMSFQAACYKILMAAKGLDSGEDKRPSHRMNGIEFRQRPKLKRSYPTTSPPSTMTMMKRRKLPISTPTEFEYGPSSSSPLSSSSTRYYSVNGNKNNNINSNNNNAVSEEALEAALNLIEKDRLECQQLGMEQLVHLTTPDIVGIETSCYISKRLLQQDQGSNNSSIYENNCSDDELNHDSKHRWRLINSLMHEQASELELPGGEGRKSRKNYNSNETYTTQMVPPAVTPSPAASKHYNHQRQQSSSSFSRGQSFLKKKSPPTTSTACTHNRRSSSSDNIVYHQNITHHHDQDQDPLSSEELRHEAKLRSLALRVFCNSLDNLTKSKELQHILYPTLNINIDAKKKGKKSNNKAVDSGNVQSTITTVSQWIRPAFLLSLVQDLQGAGRPPSVSESGYKLTSIHEAALAVRSLRLLAGYCSTDEDRDEDEEDKDANCEVNGDDDEHCSPQSRIRLFLRSEAILERLEYARSCGRATHAVLQYEAECIYHRLTENVRSC